MFLAAAILGGDPTYLQAGNPYVKGGIGYFGSDDTVDAVWNSGQEVYNFEAGYDFGRLGVGLEYLYSPNDVVDLHALMINGYYYFPKSDLFVSAGFGGVHPKNDMIDFDTSNITTAYQVGAGAEIQLYKNIEICPTVGYFNTITDIHEGDVPVDIETFYAKLGLKINL